MYISGAGLKAWVYVTTVTVVAQAPVRHVAAWFVQVVLRSTDDSTVKPVRWARNTR
jgi:hypothetical protein